MSPSVDHLTNTTITDETAWHHLVPRLLSEHGSRTVAEIGVWRGELSERILAQCPAVKQLLLADPWQVVYGHNLDTDHWMVFGPGTEQADMDAACAEVHGKFDTNTRVHIFKMSSIETADLCANDTFDAVIIDALHTYHACKADILAWVPKVRVGGLLIGDDLSDWFPGVKMAVEECFGHDYRALGQTYWKIVTEDDHVRLARIARDGVSQ